nr:uncharacterized protein LOC111511950 isoform X1 [Leptinotarsa decemlineata]
MVNSGPFDSDGGQGDRNAKASCTQPHTASDSTQSSSPVTASVASSRKTGCSQTADSDAIGPTPTKTEFNSDMPLKNISADDDNVDEEEKSSPPMETVRDVLPPVKPTRKLLCLYCDRTFVSSNLRQKHVKRVHSAKKNRRLSSRKQGQIAAAQCVHCDRLDGTENTLTDLFQHLVNEHSNKYFGCIPCEDRFPSGAVLADHNTEFHFAPPIETTVRETPSKLTRSRVKPKPNPPKLKELRCKKMSIKSSRIALKRRESKRIQALSKIPEKRRPKPSEKKQPGGKPEQPHSTKSTEKTKSSCVNPYPEFDNFYRVKKITDHSIDNLKISSLTFDDVFDKAFFNRIKCNIEENLLHHIDGKLFKNEESETRISNFEKIPTTQQEVQNPNSDNYGCELSLNAVTPVPSLSLNSQFGEDFESQIEYGAKPSKKKTQTKKDEVHYKYFTRRKYQACMMEQKENRDLSKLDMWTQLVIKNRQQKIIDDNKTAREIFEYSTCNEYQSKLKREELNRILDRRGPFEDLREEASKKAALDKLNSDAEDSISHESFTHVREVLDEVLARVFAATENDVEVVEEKPSTSKKQDLREIPSYLNLQLSSSQHGDIDKSDKITLICSSQETENFELPTNQVRGKNELVELSGEWARSRMYICAACGAKLPNMKYLLEHKTLYHQNVWVQHYEFVGNQSELYRHLSIPALGKVGEVENSVQCKLWKRSEARACTKCGKQCNALGELHRHVLECGGDWTWMLARKKCKYRPFGAKSRRKKRGLVQRIRHKQKTDSTEKKKYKKTFEGPRQRPSDADTIQRMLANLPAKRSTRKLISLYDGVCRARKNNQMQQNVKQKKVKCGKVIYKSSNMKENTEKTINTARVAIPQKSSGSSRRSLRTLNRVLSSRILDTNTKLTVKRKMKVLNERRRTRQSLVTEETNENNAEDGSELASLASQDKKLKKDKLELAQSTAKRTSPRSTAKNTKKMTMKKLLSGNINIKSFFPVKKRENKKASRESIAPGAENNGTETKSRSRKSKDALEENVVENIPKKSKDTFEKLVRSLSMRKKKIPKLSPPSETLASETSKEPSAVDKPTKEDLDKTNKKRKLKRSFRNVINRVKRLKIDNASEVGQEMSRTKGTSETNVKSTFLEERQPEKPNLPPQPVKIVVPSNLEAKENTADISETAHIVMNLSETNESSIMPENIFKLESNNEKNLQAKGELNFDTKPDNKQNIAENCTKITETDLTKSDKTQPITIETSEKPKIVPMISPNMKGKIRKPARGLNDCIAMLTNKLQQKTTETIAKVGIFNLLPSRIAPKVVEDPHPPKTECILRIPTFKTQDTVEETALDLTTKPKNSFVNPPLFGKVQISNPLQNLLLPNNSFLPPKSIKKWNSVDRIIEDVVENKNSNVSATENVVKYKLPEESTLRSWNSVDEIIQTVVSGYQVEEPRERSRTTVDDVIDFVVAGNVYGAERDATTPDINTDALTNKIRKSRSVNDLNLVSEKKLSSVTKREEKISTTSTMEEEIARRSEAISDTIDFVVSGGSFDVPTPETAKYVIHESKSKPERKIGSLRKQKKKVSKISIVGAEETPPKVEAVVLKVNLCPADTEGQSRQKNVCDENKEIKSHVASNSTSIQLEVSDDKSNVTKTCDIAEDDSPLIEKNANSLYSISADPLEPTLNKAFIQSPKVDLRHLQVNRVNRTSRKVGQVRKGLSKQRKSISSENKPVPAVIETHLDDLLDIQEMNCQSELSVSSFKISSIASSSELSTKDLKLCNEDEPRIFENKAVIESHPSDSDDDIPLISLLRVNEKNANENESVSDKADPENVSGLLIQEQGTFKAANDSLGDQNKDSGIETDRSEESGSIDSEKINVFAQLSLRGSPELGLDSMSKNIPLIEDPLIEKDDVCRSARTLCTNIQNITPGDSLERVPEKINEKISPTREATNEKSDSHENSITSGIVIGKTMRKENIDEDFKEEPNINTSTTIFKPPVLKIKKPVSGKTRNSKSKKSNSKTDKRKSVSIVSLKSLDHCDSTDMPEASTPCRNIQETDLDDMESLLKLNIDERVSESTDEIDQINELLPSSSKNSGDKMIINENYTLLDDIAAETKLADSHSEVMKNNNILKGNTQHQQKKVKRRSKSSRTVGSKPNKTSLDEPDSDEIIDSLPLSILVSKDIPLVTDMSQSSTETEQSKLEHIEEEKDPLPLKTGVEARSIDSANIRDLTEPPITRKIRKNKRKIGKRMKKVTPKLLLSISHIMETTNPDILSLNSELNKKSESILSETSTNLEFSEIKSQTDVKGEIHSNETMELLLNLEETDTRSLPNIVGDIICQSKLVQVSGSEKIPDLPENNSVTNTRKKVQRRSRSLKNRSLSELSDGVDISGPEKLHYSATDFTDVTTNILPNDENSNIFTKCIKRDRNVESEDNEKDENSKVKHVDEFVEQLNGNRSSPKPKKAIKNRSHSCKTVSTNEISIKNQTTAFRDAKPSFIGEPVVDLVRCETQLLIPTSEPSITFQSDILEPLTISLQREESQVSDTSDIDHRISRKRTTDVKANHTSDSSNVGLTGRPIETLEPEKLESAVEVLLKTPTDILPGSQKKVSEITIKESVEQNYDATDMLTPTKRSCRSLKTLSDESPLSECKSSDRELSESDVEFKIKTPPKRSPRSLRIRNIINKNNTTNKNQNSSKESSDTRVIRQVKRKAKSSKNDLATPSDDSFGNKEKVVLKVDETEMVESNLCLKPEGKSWVSRSLENSFEISLAEPKNSIEINAEWTEQTETHIDFSKEKPRSETNPLIALGDETYITDISNSKTKGNRRTTESEVEETPYPADMNLDFITVNSEQVAALKNEVIDNINSPLNKIVEGTIQSGKEETSTKLITSLEQPLTKSLSKNNTNSLETNEISSNDFDGKDLIHSPNDNIKQCIDESITNKSKTQIFRRSQSFKENCTVSTEESFKGISSHSDIEITQPVNPKNTSSKTKRLNKRSKLPKSGEPSSNESIIKQDEIGSLEPCDIEMNFIDRNESVHNQSNSDIVNKRTRKISQKRSKSLKGVESISAEAAEIEVLGSNETALLENTITKRPTRSSRSVKNTISSMSQPEKFSEEKLVGNVEVLMHPVVQESQELVELDSKSISLTKFDTEAFCSTPGETDKSEVNPSDKYNKPSKRTSSLNKLPSFKIPVDNINKEETQYQPVSDAFSPIENPNTRSRSVKITNPSEINFLTLSKEEPIKSVNQMNLSVTNDKEKNEINNDKTIPDIHLETHETESAIDKISLLPHENGSRSLRKKSAVNYSEIEENNDSSNPITTTEKVSARNDGEPTVNVKKNKARKSNTNKVGNESVFDMEDSEKRNPCIISKISNTEISAENAHCVVPIRNEDCLMKEISGVTVSLQGETVFNGNIPENTIETSNILPSSTKQTKKSSRNGKVIRKKRTKSRATVGVRLQPPTLENLTKDIQISPSTVTQIDKDVPNHVSDVTSKQLDIKEPPIKIIINTQKTRRKSKSIKKIGHKGQNDLFEDFSLVIKKKRSAPLIAFTPPNTFADETTYPLFLSRPIEKRLSPEKKEPEVDDLDVSVEEMDMEIDEIPITSNIIENSLSLALPIPLEGPPSETVPEVVPEAVLEKVEMEIKATRVEKESKSFEGSKEDLDILEKQDSPEELVFSEKQLTSEISQKIPEKKTELVSPKKGKRKSKSKSLRKDSSKTTSEVNDQVDELIIESSDQPEFSQLFASKKLESISGCNTYATEKHVDMDEIEAVKTPDLIEPVYKTIDNHISGELSTKEVDIDRIYAFSETEDFELEKPIELPGRFPRSKDDELRVLDEPLTKTVTKKKAKLSEELVPEEKQETSFGEIKESETESKNFGRRKSMRSAKIKALEHIHDDAVADLTESERHSNSKAMQSSVNEMVDSVSKKSSSKKQKKSLKPSPLIEGLNFSRGAIDGESPILAELVAELHGLEELENSIERELSAENDEKVEDKESVDVSLDIVNSHPDPAAMEDNQERRRSRRGSKKVASYNENDLVDPILDEIEGKKKTKKIVPSESKVSKKAKEPVKKLNSEELFDLLKASTDSIYVPKQQNSFLNNLEDTSRDLNDDNFDSVFNGALKKSVVLGQSTEVKSKVDIEKVYEFTESPEDSEKAVDEPSTKRNSVCAKPPVDDTVSSISNSSFLLPTPDLQDSSRDSGVKVLRSDRSENYCQICNKSFIRIENLIKHKRTLTHIQKLSELEAREAEKSKTDEVTGLIETAEAEEIPAESLQDAGCVVEAESHSLTVQSSFSNNHSLKLADIINDVLNKPVSLEKEEHMFSDILQDTNELQAEVKRYKSLGERKSFDSESALPSDRAVSDSFESKTMILEKQISLLEGIIEHQATNNYIDDISISSDSLSGRQSPSDVGSKLEDEATRNDLPKPLADDGSFIKPVQYEEISEDSANLRNYEDQKLRKTLNRDEELFLECCSLLKSGSEVSSSYSNKRLQNKVMSTGGLRQVDEPEWLEKKSLVQKPQYDIIDDSDDNSRIPTPLGDSYDDDASNSNTISSNWDMTDRVPEVCQDGRKTRDKKFHFEEISKEKLQDQSGLKFEGLLASDRTGFSTEDVGNFPKKTRTDTSSEGSSNDPKRVITKGARKVFEGLKVSIPTEELNLEEVLNSSPKPRKLSKESHLKSDKLTGSPTLPVKAPRKSKPVKKSQVGSNLLFKVNKKKVLSPGSGKNGDSKNYDVYDFEETQDGTDVFTKPDYRTFRTLKNGEPSNELESETDSREYLDTFSLGPESVTSSTSSLPPAKKPKTQENITKKKCMIMGRIFKNTAAKTKIEDIDEEIRDIPIMNHEELVESYVADCKKVIRNEGKPRLSETEINVLFDQLLENRTSDKEGASSSVNKTTPKQKQDLKKAENKKKVKAKGKKRARTNSASSDDEFSLNKTIKKRSSKKNGKEEDNCINLEQELKECIGVASRKSQRKCTSGKQNVLMEYWSSDESQFEAILETQRAAEPEVAEASPAVEPPIAEEQPKDQEVFDKPKSVSKKPHKKKLTERKKSKSHDPAAMADTATSNRRKRAAPDPLYHWSSSSEDEANDLIEVRSSRDELEDEEDRPVQHGWIVGESPKKLVMMLAQAKGKKTDIDCVKEQGKKRTNAVS